MKLGALLSLGFDRYIKGILRFFDEGEVTPAKVDSLVKTRFEEAPAIQHI